MNRRKAATSATKLVMIRTSRGIVDNRTFVPLLMPLAVAIMSPSADEKLSSGDVVTNAIRAIAASRYSDCMRCIIVVKFEPQMYKKKRLAQK